MGGFEDPVSVFGISDQMAVPFDLQMASNLFETRRSRKGVDIELGLGKHQELNLRELRDIRLRWCKTMEGILLSSTIFDGGDVF